MKRSSTIFALWILLCCPWPVLAGDDATLSTFWPIFDYRSSPAVDYQSLHLFGPFLKYESKGIETEYALRPLFYRAVDEDGDSRTDVLYPVFSHKGDPEVSSFHLLHLLSYDFGIRESGSSNRSYLFPFLFYGEEEQGSYAAFFPFGGTLYNWFGRDRITFTLFPLYGRTERNTTRIDNILWPFFARISGENESGYKFWPVYGASSKQGVYRKRFFLWPVFFSESVRLDSDNPEERRAAWPLYVSNVSRQKSYRAVLWPFFSRTDHHAKEYRSWDAPWPLIRVTRGEQHHGLKILPFFADETMDVRRQRWYLWPLYKIEELQTEQFERRRDRVLFFLYSDTRETRWESEQHYRRVDFWPLYGYQQSKGVSHLHILSLVEPFFPGNQSIERLWSPLWRLYQQKWDRHGNHVVSLLWNLYWHEKQSEAIAWELFPLVEYRKAADHDKKVRILKGLFSYRSDDSGKHLHLFYTPWGLHWDAPLPETM